MVNRDRFLIVLFAFVFASVSVSSGLLLAKDPKDDNASVQKDLQPYADRAAKSAAVLTEVMGVPETSIPSDLMDRAKAIAVIPHVIKGAFVVGGRYGKGLVSQRMPNGAWSAPAFIEIGGGSFGLQIGGEA